MRIARQMLLLGLVACSGAAPAPAPMSAPASGASDNAPACPATAPADRSSCPRLLLKCRYPGEARCPFAHCADVASELRWVTSYDHCPIACPPSQPAAGTACAPVTSKTCEYGGGPKCGYRLRCTPSGWTEEEITLCGGM